MVKFSILMPNFYEFQSSLSMNGKIEYHFDAFTFLVQDEKQF